MVVVVIPAAAAAITGCNRNLILFNFQCESNILIIINSLFYLTEFDANAKFHRQSIKSIVVSLVFDFWRVSSWATYLWESEEWVSMLDLLNGLSGRTELCEVILQIRLRVNIVMTFHSAPNIFESIHSFVITFWIFALLGASFWEFFSLTMLIEVIVLFLEFRFKKYFKFFQWELMWKQ